MADQGPKSAFELAMERLNRKDTEAGVEQRRMTDRQKAAIAEVRNLYSAKLAQEEVMHKSALMQSYDPLARAELEAQYQRERERLVRERDGKVERIRNEEGNEKA